MKASSRARLAQGIAAIDAGDLGSAESIFQAIVRDDPEAHDAWLNLAVIALRAGSPAVAVERARRAVELDRRNPLYLNNLGIAYGEQGDLGAAERAFRRALKLKPAYAGAHCNLAKALHKQGRLAESLKEFERAYALDSAALPIQLGLCRVYRLHGEPERALAVMRAASGEEPARTELVPAWVECIADVEGPHAALGWLQEALTRQPDSPVAHYMMAELLLSLGKWHEGWKHYLWRPHVASGRAMPVDALPARLDGKQILLRAEQGLGDILFFLRFVPSLRDRGATVTLEPPGKLAPLLDNRIAISEQRSADLQVWIGDLPALLQADSTPAPFALRPHDANAMRARERLARLGPPPYLGLTWRAGTNILRMPEYGTDLALLFKEIPPALLGKVVRSWPGTLVSLQRGPAPTELEAIRGAAAAAVHDLSAANEDLPEILAILSCLDEYVAVSNTNMHLLAGLGRTARVLVPHPAEWRWMRSGAGSPWFPGFGLYRQPVSRDWTEPLKRLRQDLFAAAGSPRRAPA